MHHLEGKRFSKLIVISREENHKAGQPYKWNCFCACGRYCKVTGPHLVRGDSKSCGGCRWKDRAFRQLWCEYKVSAKRRDISWRLTEKQFRNITSAPCYYTGRLPSKSRTLGTDTYVYNGIDRKDNTKGYTVENSVPCCSEVNYAKLDMSYSDFIQLCKEVTQKTQKAA
jgi:hypothetical protein